MSLISIVIPVFNEQDNIPLIYQEVVRVISPLGPADTFEFVFVNDGSRDGTSTEIAALLKNDSRVRFIEFSRNFGKEIATSAGLHYSRGEAVILVDCDLQHPVDLIPEFIRRWRAGADVVVGVRTKNEGGGLLKRVGSVLFYKLLNLIGDTEIAPGSTDFRLLDRKVVAEFRRFGEHNRMTRALIDWMGFRRDRIEFVSPRRAQGTAGYSLRKLVRLAASGLISHSLLPLKLAGYLGLVITLLSGTAGFLILVGRLVFRNPFCLSFTGPAQLAILIVFLVGIILISLGIIALYIASMHEEIMNKPMYIIRSHNFDGD